LDGLKAKLGYVEERCCARGKGQEAVRMVTYSYIMAAAEAGMVVVVSFSVLMDWLAVYIS
jgi:hypothetical protein